MNYPTRPLPKEWVKKSRHGKHKRKCDNVIAIDGEGITRRPNAKQDYMMIAASTGEHLETAKGHLTTAQCFQFLLSLPWGLVVGFYLDYDIDEWLRDVDQSHLQELKDEGATRWGGYTVRWVPGKKFSLSGFTKRDKRSVVVWDCGGFFQCRFTDALRQWQSAPEDAIKKIESMKGKRGVFKAADMPEMLAYCLSEVQYLKVTMEKLIETTESVGLTLLSYTGAGSIASALMTKHRVKEYLAAPPQELLEPMLTAYFGGWFETSGAGYVDEGYNYDINSAYPTETLNLPCLKCGTWRQSKRIVLSGLYRVTWEGSATWGPFPWRNKKGEISRPLKGEGWYWGVEVKAAQRYWKNRGNLEVLDGWVYETECGHRPFGFVTEVYAKRQELKAAGDFGQIILKLGLNSLSGKTAQSIGHKEHAPPFQSWVWAGMITAGCRARILGAVGQKPEAIRAVATDGIMSTEKLNLPVGPGLGEWEFEPVKDCFMVKSGVYQYTTVDGKLKTKNRGFSRESMDFNLIKREFDAKGFRAQWKVKGHHFVGLAWSLQQRPKLKHWLHWIDTVKTATLTPTSRVWAGFGGSTGEGERFIRTRPRPSDGGMSKPYKPKMTWDEPMPTEVEAVLLGSRQLVVSEVRSDV